MNVNQIRDAEVVRQQRNNLTDSQKKNIDATKEGVVVNSFIKNDSCVSMDDVYDSMIISDNVKMPKKLYEGKKSKEKSLLPISLIATGVMSAMALITMVATKSAKAHLTLRPEHKIEAMPRNLSINEETQQAIYQIVQCPSQKTILAGTGVFVLTAMAFMGKMFMDGFKDVWVKKREADIQKNLQEKLIAVETQSFSGKIQIIRSMLSEKGREFDEYLTAETDTLPAFKRMMSFDKANFMGKTKENESKDNLKYFALGVMTLGAIVGLGFVSMKNLRKGKEYIKNYIADARDKITEIVAGSGNIAKDVDKTNLKNLLRSIEAEPKYIKDELNKLNWEQVEKEEFIDEVSFDIQKSVAKADRALGGEGPPKPTVYSHVNDYRAFFYNWILDKSNPLFKNLFFGITGITALSYGGKVLGEAVKDVQVKKMNAQTELELQQRLVSTELRNFKAKKDAAINPLCEEFYAKVQKGKPKVELKTMAENILFEVKNGPPFVYS